MKLLNKLIRFISFLITMWYKVNRIMMRPNGVEKQVRPKTRNPWANTVGYYPLNTDFDDYSWNSRNLTNTNATITTLGGVSCAYYWGNAYSTYTGYSLIRDARTTSVWMNPSDLTDWVILQPSAYNVSPRWSMTTAVRWGDIMMADNNSISIDYSWTIGNWYHVVGTQEGSTVKMYVNWTLIWTKTRPSYSTPNWWRLWAQFTAAAAAKYVGYISNAILENKVWTAQEILDYYNQTKANYWL